MMTIDQNTRSTWYLAFQDSFGPKLSTWIQYPSQEKQSLQIVFFPAHELISLAIQFICFFPCKILTEQRNKKSKNKTIFYMIETFYLYNLKNAISIHANRLPIPQLQNVDNKKHQHKNIEAVGWGKWGHYTWPSERNPATSMTVLNSLGSNSGLFTPTLASATSIPAQLCIFLFKILTLVQ